MEYKIEDIDYFIEGRGPYIIFLHGWGQDKKSFKDISYYLKKKYTCLMLDLPGFGNSKFPEKALSIDDYGDLLNEFILKNKLNVKAIIGHSFGGKVATNYCLRYNGHLKLILCSPSIVKPIHGPIYYGKVGLYKLGKKIPKLKNYLDKKIGSKDYKNSEGVLREILVKSVNTYYDKDLYNIDNDTLLYWGKEDKTTPLYMGRKIERKIPNCKLITIEGNHFAFKDNKYHFINALEEFLDD
ncbi:MAG: alpha/beta hydrolase [Erysipelotrichaceae bacterium]|nr:alpha/beta hydrolase [Erysipelotrichaceae bacterium]